LFGGARIDRRLAVERQGVLLEGALKQPDATVLVLNNQPVIAGAEEAELQ
jgi:hypothetical protein